MNANMMNMITRTDFLKEMKPTAKSTSPENSDFLKQIKSLQMSAEKANQAKANENTASEKASQSKANENTASEKASQSKANENTASEKANQSKANENTANEKAADANAENPYSEDEDKADKAAENFQNAQNAQVMELLAMLLPSDQNQPVVVDVSKILLTEEKSKNPGLGAIPEVNGTDAKQGEVTLQAEPKQLQGDENPFQNAVNQAAQQAQNQENIPKQSDDVSLAGQAAAQAGKEMLNTPQEKPVIQSGHQEVKAQETKPISDEVNLKVNLQEQQKANETPKETENSAALKAEQAAKAAQADTKPLDDKQSIKTSKEVQFKVSDEKPQAPIQKPETDAPKSDNKHEQPQTNIPKEKPKSDENLFVTDRFRKNMDKLEEMLSAANAQTPRDYKADVSKVKEPEFVPEANVAQQVSKEIFSSLKDGTKELVMQLQPKELGKLMIKLSMENNRLTVNITAENLHAQKTITEQLGILESAMKSQNVVVDRINVSYESFNNMNSSNTPNNPNGFMFGGQDKNNHGSTENSWYTQNNDSADDGLQNPEPVQKMIIGNDILNYVV